MLKRENLYPYIQLAKSDPQQALTKLDKWIGNHINWIADFIAHGRLSDCQGVVSKPLDDFNFDFENINDTLDHGGIDDLDESDFKDLLDDFRVCKRHKKPVWLDSNNQPATAKEAVKAIEVAGKTINLSNKHAYVDTQSLEYNPHENQSLFCYKTPKQVKAEKASARKRQQKINADKQHIQRIKKHMKSLK